MQVKPLETHSWVRRLLDMIEKGEPLSEMDRQNAARHRDNTLEALRAMIIARQEAERGNQR